MSKMKRELEKMKREVTGYRAWHQIETEDKFLLFPTDGSSLDKLLKDHPGGNHSIVYGHGARLMRSGLLGSTDWHVFQTHQGARDYLTTYYGSYEEDDLPRIAK